MTKHCYIKTYGCQMNVYDSTRMAEQLAKAGYAPTQSLETADMVILNTCHIREKAAEKVYSELGRMRRLKTARPDVIFGVAGCVAQAEGEEIVTRAPMVDLVFGPQTYHALPQMLAELAQARANAHPHKKAPSIIRTAFPTQEKFAHLKAQSHPRHRLTRSPSAFVTIQEGCDKFCTFCVVPYTRGGEVSRPLDDIVTEARALTETGACEITLLGQNVNAWCDANGERLANLLTALHDIDALARLRFTTSHPRDMDAPLIDAFGSLPKLMPSFHLPIQSGSDDVLRAMNRRHSASDYCQTISDLRAVRPDIAISSDFIVGFPGESDADFTATLALIERIGFAQAFSFKYSPRPGTPAAALETQIDERIKSARLAQLQDLLNQQQRSFNDAQIGKTLPVLFEKQGRKQNEFSGRSPYGQLVHVAFSSDGDPDPIGQILPIHIETAHNNSLRGAYV